LVLAVEEFSERSALENADQRDDEPGSHSVLVKYPGSSYAETNGLLVGKDRLVFARLIQGKRPVAKPLEARQSFLQSSMNSYGE
jgi:hypothetical protein